MEIALSSLTAQFDASASIESARQNQRQQQDARRPASSNDTRNTENQRPTSRAEASQQTPENSRVINGEVLSSETSRVALDDTARNNLSRAGAGQQQPAGEPDSRRISAQQALQNFQENEALVANQNNPRQVSGIIDEFV